MALKLEVGKFYRTRDGRKIGPMRNDKGIVNHPWDDEVSWHFYSDDGRADDGPDYDLIAEWTDTTTSPVRTVTRKEVVPGVYGALRVDAANDCGKVLIGFDRSHLDDGRIKHGALMQAMDAKQLRALAETAIALADALENNE